MWEAKIIAAADVDAETNRKHKVTPDWGDLIMLCIRTEVGSKGLGLLQPPQNGLFKVLKIITAKQIQSPSFNRS